MIPKRIFYCWFGPNRMSEESAANIAGWREACPDYEIVRVDESVFDPTSHPFSKLAAENGNWAFVADVARIEALRQGGVYLDVDTKLLKPLDAFLGDGAFCCACARGFYSNFMLGCEELPEVFEATLDVKPGESMNVKMNRELYSRYRIFGDEREDFGDVVLYGTSYVANTRTPVTERTVAVNQEENTWLDWWKNGFEPMSDIIPFDIYRHGELRLDETMAVYGRRGVGVLELDDGVEATLDVTEMGNYFNNPDVMLLEGHGARFTRPLKAPMAVKEIWGGYRLGHVER